MKKGQGWIITALDRDGYFWCSPHFWSKPAARKYYTHMNKLDGWSKVRLWQYDNSELRATGGEI